jgi:RNA polymerase sigma factor (sigma-70 family)
MSETNINILVGHLFRHEAGKMVSVLTRLLGFHSVDLAEDIVQDTLLKAMSAWKLNGLPENPSAWLYTVAKRKAIDVIRQQQVKQHHHSEISRALQSEWTLSPTVNNLFLENEVEDSQLRMIFACCHPSIPYEAQLALTLKTLCGLSAAEIANSFLTNEETITKRIYRAKEKIKEENISLEVPVPAHIPGRIDAVLHSLYLLFNEGYNSSHPDQLIRQDLCEEAIRLCLLLTRNPLTNTPKSNALLALMCFQASRDNARIGDDGNIILLKDQDRSRWNKSLIERGMYYQNAASAGDELSEYHIEAAIAGCHADAASFKETNWEIILKLYSILLQFKPGPIIELNHAIATGYALSPAEGLKALEKISSLNNHYLYHAARGDFLMEAGEFNLARKSYDQALLLTQSSLEKKLLKQKIEALPIPGSTINHA